MTLDLFFNEPEQKEDVIELDKFDTYAKEQVLTFLKKCDEAYYTEGENPLIDDTTYDLLRAKAHKKWKGDVYFKDVGFIPIKGVKVEHSIILGSLKKTKSDPKDSQFVDTWLKKFPNEEIVITPKLDGLSLHTIYNKEFDYAATRGNGKVGQLITEKVRFFAPKIKDMSTRFEFRGEIMLPGDTYKELEYKNRRNGASGIIGDDNPANLDKLDIMYYELIGMDSQLVDDLTEAERLDIIQKCFPDNSVEYKKVKCSDLTNDMLLQLLEEWTKKYSDIDLDGLVLTVNDSAREDVKHPKKKVAYKNNETGKVAIVDSVVWNTGRTGRVVPKVVLREAVELSGATVSQATAYNAAFIRDNNIGTGTRIKIIRSGEVIPRIIEILK